MLSVTVPMPMRGLHIGRDVYRTPIDLARLHKRAQLVDLPALHGARMFAEFGGTVAVAGRSVRTLVVEMFGRVADP